MYICDLSHSSSNLFEISSLLRIEATINDRDFQIYFNLKFIAAYHTSRSGYLNLCNYLLHCSAWAFLKPLWHRSAMPDIVFWPPVWYGVSIFDVLSEIFFYAMSDVKNMRQVFTQLWYFTIYFFKFEDGIEFIWFHHDCKLNYYE